jgi:hypothetical protein
MAAPTAFFLRPEVLYVILGHLALDLGDLLKLTAFVGIFEGLLIRGHDLSAGCTVWAQLESDVGLEYVASARAIVSRFHWSTPLVVDVVIIVSGGGKAVTVENFSGVRRTAKRGLDEQSEVNAPNRKIVYLTAFKLKSRPSVRDEPMLAGAGS